MYIRFVKGTSLVSYLVRLFTLSTYSHVDFFMENKGQLIGSYPFQGVTLNAVNTDIRNDPKSYLIYIPEKYQADIYSFIANQLGKGYDYKAILAFIFFTRRWQDKKRWFCSEIAAAALYDSGLLVETDERFNRIAPSDLIDLLLKKGLVFKQDT